MQGCEMRMLDLFTGLAGFTLAAHEVWGDDLETVSFVEIDRRCREFLARAWPGVPIHDDIKTLDAKKWRGTIDLLTGGVPCQPASRAGKQRGKEDDRWLWDQALRVCEECLPTWCLFENPPSIGDVGLDGILSALEGIGYETQTIDIPACAVNSPQLRHRYWIICWLDNTTKQSTGAFRRNTSKTSQEQTRISWKEFNPSIPGRSGQGDMADHNPSRCISEQEQHSASEQSGEQAQSRRYLDGCGELYPKGVLLEHTERGKFGEICNESEEERSRLCHELPGIGTGLRNAWSSYVWLPCADGKVRRAPDDSQCMAHGLPVELLEALGEEGREGWTPEDCEPHRRLLGALGNSIVPQVAVEIFKAMKGAGLRR